MKRRLEDLALLGGEAAFADPLHVGRPNIGERSRLFDRLNDILDTRWLSNGGRYEQEFEQRIAAMVGARHCIAVCNGTAALELAIRALRLGGDVVVPSFTFVATAHALAWWGINPVFCDVDPISHNLDPREVERAITPATTAILGVHLWGRPCDTEALEQIAQRHEVKLLFDAAHAFGCSHSGRMIGTFGNAEIFSFHATKIVNAFEGGAVVTNDDELADELRLLKNFGFAGYDRVTGIGTNGKMSEASAAMGLTSLESLHDFVAVNRRNHTLYAEELRDATGLSVLPYEFGEDRNWQYVVLEVDEKGFGLSRDDLQRVLWAENVLARRYFYPGCHRMEPYRSSYPEARLRLPRTEELARRVLCLPTGTSIGPAEIATISAVIRFAAGRHHELAARLHPLPPERREREPSPFDRTAVLEPRGRA